jgi:MFS superfamily sulfate permease-like transporter
VANPKTISKPVGKRSARKAVASSILREIAAGIVLACLSVPICVAAGVLVYTPFGGSYVAQGALAGLFCAVVGGVAGAIFRRSSFVTTIPTTPIALVQASSVSALLASIGDADLVALALPIMVLMVAAWQLLFGLTGLSRIIKFTPYPVLAGFVTGIGLLIVMQQLPVLFGVRSLPELASAFLSFALPNPAIPAFGWSLVAIIVLIGLWLPRVPNLLAGLVIGYVGYHALLWLAPGMALGPTIGAISIQSIWSWPLIDSDGVRAIWSSNDAIRIVLFGSLTLTLLGTLDTFFALRTAQLLADIDVTPRRDVIGQGLANAVSAISGGLVVSTSISLSTANYRSGGRSRISTIASGLTLLAGTLLFPSVIFSLPLVVLAAILVVASLRVFDRWTLSIAREALFAKLRADRGRARINLLIVTAVLAATVLGQPVIGAAAGVALSCLVFIAQMSRPVIGRRWSGDVVHSKRVRTRHDSEVLRRRGGRIKILDLQGVLFFGNSDDLASDMRELEAGADTIILDLHRVSDIDTSGATALQQVATRFRASGKSLLLCGLDEKFEGVLRPVTGKGGVRSFPDRDTALEWAEEKIISAESSSGSLDIALAESDLVDQMTSDEIGILARHLALETYPPSAALCRAGDPADRMWIIKRGSVSVRIGTGRSEKRLASLGPGCSVGEMGLLDHRPRSADVYADDIVEAYLMSGEAFATLMERHPRIGQAILINFARQLSQRLRDTSEELRLASA